MPHPPSPKPKEVIFPLLSGDLELFIDLPGTSDRRSSAMIQLYHVYKYYHQVPALLDINLRIFKGDLAFVTGASGAGKSTLLKLLYLAERCSRGKIVLAGRELEQLGSVQTAQLRRSIGVVFQDFKLIPYKTVFENVAIALEVVGASGTLIERKVGELLRALGLFHKRSTLPPALAGGEQQRVAIARALISDPPVLLMDEPFSALDEIMRQKLDFELLNIKRKTNKYLNSNELWFRRILFKNTPQP